MPHSTNKQSETHHLKQSAYLVLLGVLCLVIHQIAMAHFRVSAGDEVSVRSVVAHIPLELSVAFLIAAVLNVVVERNTQARHRELEQRVQERLQSNADLMNDEMRKNLLRAVFNQNLGPNVTAEVENKLFHAAPYRLECDAAYSLRICTAGTEKIVLVGSHLRFVVFNPTRQAARIPLYFCTTSPDEFAGYSNIRDIKCDNHSIMDQEVLKAGRRGGTIEYKDDKGCDIPPLGKRLIEVFYERAEYLESNEVFVGTQPCEELRVSVAHPIELRVQHMAAHTGDTEVLNETDSSKTWRLRGVIPGQGIMFWWRPVAPSEYPKAASA